MQPESRVFFMLAKVNIQRPSQGEIDEGLKGREGGGGDTN